MCSPWDGPSESAVNVMGMAAGVCCAADMRMSLQLVTRNDVALLLRARCAHGQGF